MSERVSDEAIESGHMAMEGRHWKELQERNRAQAGEIERLKAELEEAMQPGTGWIKYRELLKAREELARIGEAEVGNMIAKYRYAVIREDTGAQVAECERLLKAFGALVRERDEAWEVQEHLQQVVGLPVEPAADSVPRFLEIIRRQRREGGE